MSVRVQRLPNHVPNPGPEIGDADGETKYTHVDGMTYAWGPGQIRNFLDDGVGVAHGAYDDSEDAITENGLFAANGQSRA
jgi:hypothetical protein